MMVYRYELQSVAPVDDYWAWYQSDDEHLYCVKIDALGVADVQPLKIIDGQSRLYGKSYKMVVGLINDHFEGFTIANEDDNFVCLARTGDTTPLQATERNLSDE